MREQVEGWVIAAADECAARSGLRGLLHLAVASETIGDAVQTMVWLVEREEELHPILAEALGEAEDVIAEVDVGAGSEADAATLAQLDFEERHGMSMLAVATAGRWDYRPSQHKRLASGDRLLLSGPAESLETVERMVASREPEDALREARR
jgi:uncharacterized protein with PhoU and TrkA domain